MWSLLFHSFVKRSVVLKIFWNEHSTRYFRKLSWYEIELFICLISCAVQAHYNGPPCNEDPFMVKLLSLAKVKLKCMEQLNEHQTEINWTQSNSNRFVFCDSLKFDNRTQSNSYLMVNSITTLIVPITIFSILICSLHACLSRNRHAITWVSNYRYPVSTSFNNSCFNGFL